MNAPSVRVRRACLKSSKLSKTHRSLEFAPHLQGRCRFSIASLAIAAALVAGAGAQDSRSNSTGAPLASTTQTSTTGAAGNVNSQSPESTVQPQTEEGQFVFKKKVEEVVLHAVVVDPQNHLMSDLSREAFSIFENGKLQRMTSFRHENVPLALGILIDNSGSMRPKRQRVNEAALNLVRSSNPHDEVFVVNFGEQYYLDQDFTDDIEKLKVALDKVETSGSTALYDSIVASAAHIRQGATIQKRVLLVVTDGNDNASQETLDETVQQLQQADGPVVYVIAFVDESKRAHPVMHALQEISLNTGGTAYFPKDLDQVNAITKSIAYDIRDQYVIGYKSSNPMTGHAYHAIQVQANGGTRDKLRVRTRTGYYSESSAASQ